MPVEIARAKFGVGQVVCHLKCEYRGGIGDVDPVCSGTDEWYDQVASSRPPRDQPWYNVLVDEGEHSTYVAERHLEADTGGQPIRHPALDRFFDAFKGGRYSQSRLIN